MAITIASTITLTEADALIAEHPRKLADVRAVLEARAAKDTPSGRRAAAWLAKHPLKGAKAQAPVAERKSGPGSRGGDPVKAERAKYADMFGGKRGTAEWWACYRTDECKAYGALNAGK